VPPLESARAALKRCLRDVSIVRMPETGPDGKLTYVARADVNAARSPD
jgi:hypothetical protein